MKDFLLILFNMLSANPIVKIVMLWIMFDTFFGVLRALKQRSFNSNFGIDGGIRKVGMIVSVIFLAIADLTIQINLISFIPKELLIFGIERIGIMEFFGILFILYETISILKNMYLLGIPMPVWLKEKLEKLLEQLTNELPNKE